MGANLFYLLFIDTMLRRSNNKPIFKKNVTCKQGFTGSPCRNFSNFCLIRGVLQWWSKRKYILKHTHGQYISHKNNIAQLYFILGTAELHCNFFSILKDAPDSHRFSNRKWVLTMCTTGNL